MRIIKQNSTLTALNATVQAQGYAAGKGLQTKGGNEMITINQNDIVVYLKPVYGPAVDNVQGPLIGQIVNLLCYTNAYGDDEEIPAGTPDSFFFRAIANSTESNYEKHAKKTLHACLKSAVRNHDLYVINSYKGLGVFLRDKVNP